MKSIKKPKQPNPNGRPLPSKFSRTFYQSTRRRWGYNEKHEKVSWIERLFQVNAEILDFYGETYRVMPTGAIVNLRKSQVV